MSERHVAIVDANNFYVSCERVFNPALEGRPVVVLSNNDGCVIARSQEAKALNVDMAAPWHTIAPIAAMQGVVAVSSNYELYGDMSARSAEILSRFTSHQEVYSIDESFIELTGTVDETTAQAREIRRVVRKLIGLPVSIGIAPTKTLAKLANRGSKQAAALAGVCHLGSYSSAQQTAILASVDAGDVWGIGRRTAKKLVPLGVHTAADLRDADAARIRKRFGVVQARVVQELRGVDCLPIGGPARARPDLPLPVVRGARDDGRRARGGAVGLHATCRRTTPGAGLADPDDALLRRHVAVRDGGRPHQPRRVDRLPRADRRRDHALPGRDRGARPPARARQALRARRRHADGAHAARRAREPRRLRRGRRGTARLRRRARPDRRQVRRREPRPRRRRAAAPPRLGDEARHGLAARDDPLGRARDGDGAVAPP
ncbi:hypothetical protein F1C15_10990 [Frigoribacterium sp. NBH87]|nr:hypothetical protein F1C15_10990 [Frigoribacterium sp. NBH87]